MEKNIRENCGFIIIAASGIGEEGYEFVLGFNPNSRAYATWKYDVDGGYNYGHYMFDFRSAVKDFLLRQADGDFEAIREAYFLCKDDVPFFIEKLEENHFVTLSFNVTSKTYVVNEFPVGHIGHRSESFWIALEDLVNRIRRLGKANAFTAEEADEHGKAKED